jgi:hypothetical protein
VLAFIVLTVGVTLWLARTYFFPQPFKPVELSAVEREELNDKLRRINPELALRAEGESDEDWLRPEPYSEAGAERRVVLSERELNAVVARDQELARRMSIDLSRDLASARILVPVDPDMPVLGGRTLRVAAGLELKYADGRPSVILRGVSIMGVPIPSAWLGGFKNKDLVAEFSTDPGFWRAWAEGVEDIRVTDGKLVIQLRE